MQSFLQERLYKKSLSRCKIFMIGDKLLSFVSATARRSDAKGIYSAVDFVKGTRRA